MDEHGKLNNGSRIVSDTILEFEFRVLNPTKLTYKMKSVQTILVISLENMRSQLELIF